jgi:hypothetical protein
MTLADLWDELEEHLPFDRAGRMVRRVHPEAAVDIAASASRTPPRRALHLRVVADAAAGIQIPSSTEGISMTVRGRTGDERTTLSLELTDPGAGDLFATVCDDIVDVTARAHDDDSAVSAWIGRFVLWQRFLQRGAGPLSPKRQRGLYAELWSMREILAPRVGPTEAVEAWKGPDRGERDFETGGVGVEVKSSAANEPQIVPINGERQLDDAELHALFVIHLSLELVRDAGETLPAIVSDLRATVRGGPAQGVFEDRVLSAGYADMHEAAYARTGYALRRLSVLRVTAGFPRITERDLPDGVGSVHYSLAIDACRDHETTVEALSSLLK